MWLNHKSYLKLSFLLELFVFKFLSKYVHIRNLIELFGYSMQKYNSAYLNYNFLYVKEILSYVVHNLFFYPILMLHWSIFKMIKILFSYAYILADILKVSLPYLNSICKCLQDICMWLSRTQICILSSSTWGQQNKPSAWG